MTSSFNKPVEISYVDINPAFNYRYTVSSATKTYNASTYGFSQFTGLAVITNSAGGYDSDHEHYYGRPTMLSSFSSDMTTLTLTVGISDSTANNKYGTSYYTAGTYTVRLYGIK